MDLQLDVDSSIDARNASGVGHEERFQPSRCSRLSPKRLDKQGIGVIDIVLVAGWIVSHTTGNRHLHVWGMARLINRNGVDRTRIFVAHYEGCMRLPRFQRRGPSDVSSAEPVHGRATCVER